MTFARHLIGAALLMALAACDPSGDRQGKDMTLPEGQSDIVADDASVTTEVPETAYAEDDLPEAEGRLEAHEHGRAMLSAAVDDDILTLTFEAPLMSVVGFEHEPETPEQESALNAAKDAFTAPGMMVEINRDAGCLPQMTTSGAHFAGGHGALEVEHVYTCEDPAEISRIVFSRMGDYPGLTSIDAVFVSDTRQVAGELTQSNATLELR
ncbi:MAG: DUF2796 domain-containing protein [Henriciella sp.]